MEIIKKEFNINSEKFIDNFMPNVNLGLGDYGLVITNQAPDDLQLFRFGFTPFWAKKKKKILTAPSNGTGKKNSNRPRVKGILRKSLFRNAIRKQRCLIIANAFIAGSDKEGLKKPSLVYRARKNRLMTFAGIWDEWIDEDQIPLRSFAIITSQSDNWLQKNGIGRSPVILNKAQQSSWLHDSLNPRQISTLLEPFDPSKYNAYRISSRIKKPGNKNPKLLKPLSGLLNKANDFNFYEEFKLAKMKDSTIRKRKK